MEAVANEFQDFEDRVQLGRYEYGSVSIPM